MVPELGIEPQIMKIAKKKGREFLLLTDESCRGKEQGHDHLALPQDVCGAIVGARSSNPWSIARESTSTDSSRNQRRTIDGLSPGACVRTQLNGL